MNKQKYLELQEQYLANRNNQKALGEMMMMIVELVSKLTNKYVQKNKIILSKEDKEDIAYSTMERILKRYKTKPTWRMLHNPVGSIWFDFFKTITGSVNIATLQQREENKCLSWNDILDDIQAREVEEEDEDEYIEYLLGL